jgi:hypothetical protein
VAKSLELSHTDVAVATHQVRPNARVAGQRLGVDALSDMLPEAVQFGAKDFTQVFRAHRAWKG